MNFSNYLNEGFFDELFEGFGKPRAFALPLIRRLESLAEDEIEQRQRAADNALFKSGATFNVYGAEEGTERILPFDLIPRLIEAGEWDNVIEKGLKQRIHALNLFLDDIYHDQKILKDNIVPAKLIRSGASYRPECAGLSPSGGVWCHITGTDLIRDNDGRLYVLEDNLRCPSGVSYVLENRRVLKQIFPQVFRAMRVRAVDDYSNRLRETLMSVATQGGDAPNIVVLSPGMFNSAYFEHSFLARQMGVQLVEGRDLFCADGFVYARTIRGPLRVDVIYRRIDDDFIDPTVFRSDSMLGVPGLVEVVMKGNVALANCLGTGVADDKAVYAYVPRIIKYYLDEDPILANVPTFICGEEKDREHVLANLDKMVVKSVNESGGYGMLIGPHASKSEREEFANKIKTHPRNFIGQPTLALSRAPCVIGDRFEGRHLDLRPYILNGKEDIYVVPGGLTRVALRKGSLVVNSSQGGGTKDTWVLDGSRSNLGAIHENVESQSQSQTQTQSA